MFTYFWERESSVGEGQRERGTEDPKQALCWLGEPNTGLELMSHEIMTWAEVGYSTDRATKCPWINLNLDDSHMWLVAAMLDSTAL